jgi:hypothetical protein
LSVADSFPVKWKKRHVFFFFPTRDPGRLIPFSKKIITQKQMAQHTHTANPPSSCNTFKKSLVLSANSSRGYRDRDRLDCCRFIIKEKPTAHTHTKKREVKWEKIGRKTHKLGKLLCVSIPPVSLYG